MYIVDITRENEFTTSDLLLTSNSTNAKIKTLKYISEYVLANYNIAVDIALLDYNLNMNCFSLKEFLKENYSISINGDLLIQSFYVDKDHCLFVKHFDKTKNSMPQIFAFNKNQQKHAQSTLAFLVNDSLLSKYENNLSLYEKKKYDVINPKLINYNSKEFNSEIISLYKEGKFMEELLDSDISFHNLRHSMSSFITKI